MSHKQAFGTPPKSELTADEVMTIMGETFDPILEAEGFGLVAQAPAAKAGWPIPL